MRILKLTVLSLTVTAFSACDMGNSKMAKLSDYELSDRHSQCLAKRPTAPGKAVACENIRKECERRKKEKGMHVCPTPLGSLTAANRYNNTI